MTDRTSAYAQAVVALADGEGALDVVEDELLGGGPGGGARPRRGGGG
jgi:hypothetical protein